MIEKVKFWMPKDLSISLEEYANWVNDLIIKQKHNWNNTVAKRTINEFAKQYNKTILATINEWGKISIIGNSSIIDTTQIQWWQIKLWDRFLKIWEWESTVVHPKYAGKWIWKKLNEYRLAKMWKDYSLLIAEH